MQIDISDKDIIRLANEIDSAHGTPQVFDTPVLVKFKGSLASFSRPEFKTEKMSYRVPTFSSIRNMLQAIYWHPGFNYIPVFCGVKNPIKWEYVATNGVKEVKKASAGGHVVFHAQTDRLQRTSQYLKDVEYDVIAFLVSRPNEMNKDDSLKKFHSIVTRRIEKGQCGYAPFLGLKECAASFEALNPNELDGEPYIHCTDDLGNMIFDFDYSDPEHRIPLFQHEQMTNGGVLYTGDVIR